MGVKEMIEAARARVEEVSPSALQDERRDGEVLVVDVRDVRERWREGTIPGSRHVPRGMLEFWSDPENRYHRDFMDPDARVVLYCAEGERSALAAVTLGELGYTDVAHLEGGFASWSAAGGDVEPVEKR
ncbi:MAG: rhodanese-like domain-containing protein [Solirubrobacterales bacterium]